MTADDAVMLLLAIVGSERVKDSVVTAQKLAALPVIKHRVNWRHESLDPYQRRTLRPLLDLPQNHTLGDALRCLFGITVLCLGQDSGNSDAQASMRLFNKTPPAFRVRVNYPQYSAHIQVKFRSFAREYWTYGVPNSVLVADGAGASTGDLTQIREFSNVTVTKVCQVLGADK